MVQVAVIFGPPGAGKGTQCGLMAERMGVTHISTGELLRSEVKAQTNVGLQVKDVLNRGDLVSDDLLFGCLKSYLGRLEMSSVSWLLLDGVPRNESQIEGLESVLTEMGLKVSKVVALEADVDQLVERFSKRWLCKCGYVGAFETVQEATQVVCPKCGSKGSFFRRDDDSPESVRHRMAVYHNTTAPVKAYYEKLGVVFTVNAIGVVENVYNDIRRLF